MIKLIILLVIAIVSIVGYSIHHEHEHNSAQRQRELFADKNDGRGFFFTRYLGNFITRYFNK